MLTKREIEVDGASKLLVMIIDVSDRVRLEQEKIKKGRGTESTCVVQRQLDEVFQLHWLKVEELCHHIGDSPLLENLALVVKRTMSNFFLKFCQFSDLIKMQNGTFR